MNRLLSRDDARDLDRVAIQEGGVPGVVLMENASRGCADLLIRLGIQGRVVLCCGPGNNGGDGLAMARHLDNFGFSSRVLLFADPTALQGDAKINYQILIKNGPPILSLGGSSIDERSVHIELNTADWIVDALFGTGMKGPIRALLDRVIESINASSARKFAIDIPTGLDADTGEPLGPIVRAHHTATIAALKKGFVWEQARPFLGQVHVIDMGLPRGI